VPGGFCAAEILTEPQRPGAPGFWADREEPGIFWCGAVQQRAEGWGCSSWVFLPESPGRPRRRALLNRPGENRPPPRPPPRQDPPEEVRTLDRAVYEGFAAAPPPPRAGQRRAGRHPARLFASALAERGALQTRRNFESTTAQPPTRVQPGSTCPAGPTNPPCSPRLPMGPRFWQKLPAGKEADISDAGLGPYLEG